jgi:molybdopterin-containing oxidoreductase family iron-sulfur binding subunit
MTERRTWRSLRVLENDPAVRDFVEGEFAPGADLPPDAVTRRDMLTLLGASLSMAGLAACRKPVENIVPYVDAPEQIMPGIPRYYATTQPAGLSAHGLLVESHEGRPTKIEGNELHPSTRGASSGRMQSAILDLYDPDRSRHVQKKGEKAAWADLVAAWKDLAKAHDADQGASLAVVVEPFSSPTQARLAAAVQKRYPKARLIAYDPVANLNEQEGIARAAGRPLLPVRQLEQARVILSLDCDFLMADPEMVANTRGYSAGRKVASEHDEMSRLYVVEGAFSVTGANADHRIRLATRHVPAFLAALVSELGRQGLKVGAPDAAAAGIKPEILKALVSDLLAHRGTSLVLCGARQPAAVHAAVAALNLALGNLSTVSYREPLDAKLPARGELADLVKALSAGEVKTLVLIGVNPAYDAPADLGFAEAAKKAVEVIHLGAAVDETAALASWHVPAAHFLESWGDARSADGTASVVQPLILPLFGGKSAVELLALLATGEDKAGYDLVRETWQKLLPGEFEKRWNRVLHDGLLADKLPAVELKPAGSPFAELAGAKADGLELVFQPCPKLHDGRSANNAWLQELPDPMTKVVWDNPLLLSPATAQAQGVTDGDVVQVQAGGRSLELSVFRVPGMADGTLLATRGYGRKAAGRVGTGVGYDTYTLRTAAALDVASGVSLTKTGRSVLLSQTQEHGSMEGRPLIREANLAEYREHPNFANEQAETPELFSLFDEQKYDKGHQWGMAIDLSSCTGCNACAVACQSENNIPVVGKDQVRRGREMAWIRIDRYFTDDPAEAGAAFQPVPCMQCENAPCEQVCPVAATVHDGEGLNVMVYNRCIGTRYCSNNCPYKVRRFNFFNYTKDTPETLKMANNPDVTVRARGVMEKCTYCVQRLNRSKLDAKLAGREMRDGDVKTACQQACPAQAIRFGDLRDAGSAVAQAKKGSRNYALLGELNSKPRTTYLARLRNPHPDLAQPAGKGPEHA